MDDHEELPLTGGRLTSGVVRIADTVRRPASPASAFTASLLNHLHANGFDACPKYLGLDDQGRDILSYIPGDVPAKWRSFDDTQIMQAAHLLRRMHGATRDFGLLDAPGQVICHHDPGPNNVVFRNSQPVAFIDFDFAAPGYPLEDLGYMAWAWCISSRPDRGPVTSQARQVRLLADTYGLTQEERSDLPASILQRLRRNTAFWTQVLGDAHTTATQHAHALEVLAWTSRESAYVNGHSAVFTSALE